MQIYKVGGAVRDQLLNLPVTEVDWVVVGGTAQALIQQGFKPVGSDFPVFLHPKTGEEYALARTERKSGHGYGGFVFHASPDVTLEQDLLRRDLTINAMALAADGTLVDPYHGQRDLDLKVLRHVSPAFAEDPLRVLRVARFAARYAELGFTVAPETLALMADLVEQGELQHLTPERVWKEMSRALMESRPAVFLEVLRACGALKVLMPELEALFGVPQRAEYHPEVDTGIHTLCVLEQSARHQQPLVVRWACLLHDLGKGLTPASEWPRHIAHGTRGLPAIKAGGDRFKVPREVQELALLVGEYHTHCHRALELRADTLLKLMQRFDVLRRPDRFEQFLAACEMDARGRWGVEDRDYPQADYLRGAAHSFRSVENAALMAAGFEGAELGKALVKARLQALTDYREANRPPQ